MVANSGRDMSNLALISLEKLFDVLHDDFRPRLDLLARLPPFALLRRWRLRLGFLPLWRHALSAHKPEPLQETFFPMVWLREQKTA